MGSTFPCCALQQAGKRQSLQQRKAVLGPQPRCYFALRSAGFCQAASARREDGRTVRKEQQKAVVEEQPALRAAASCCSPLCNACLDSCHGNKFILRPGQHLATVWQSGQEPVQPAASPAGPRETGGMRDGVRFHACKVVCQLQDSDWWFPYPKSTGELQGDPSEVMSWTASVCGIMMALALQHKELRNEDGEPRSKEMLAKHKESLPLVSVSSTKKIPPAYQS